jgi:hypothetical protein
MRSDQQWVAITTAAIEFVHGHNRPDIDPSTMLAAINRKVTVTADDLDVAAMRAKQLGAHLRRAARRAKAIRGSNLDHDGGGIRTSARSHRCDRTAPPGWYRPREQPDGRALHAPSPSGRVVVILGMGRDGSVGKRGGGRKRL